MLILIRIPTSGIICYKKILPLLSLDPRASRTLPASICYVTDLTSSCAQSTIFMCTVTLIEHRSSDPAPSGDKFIRAAPCRAVPRLTLRGSATCRHLIRWGEPCRYHVILTPSGPILASLGLCRVTIFINKKTKKPVLLSSVWIGGRGRGWIEYKS